MLYTHIDRKRRESSRPNPKLLTAATVSIAACSATAFGGLIANDVPVIPAGPIGSLVPSSGVVAPAAVTPLDTFNVAAVGFNSNGSGAFLTAKLDPTFGLTQTFANSALGGQSVTVTSSESIGLSTTTDTITFGVPTNFIPAGTTFNGLPITTLEFDVGGFNAGTDPLNFIAPIDPSTLTLSGSILYGTNSTIPLTPGDTLFAGNSAIALSTSINAGGGDLSGFAIRSVTFTATYATTVPEPTTVAGLVIGGVALLARRRRVAYPSA